MRRQPSEGQYGREKHCPGHRQFYEHVMGYGAIGANWLPGGVNHDLLNVYKRCREAVKRPRLWMLWIGDVPYIFSLVRRQWDSIGGLASDHNFHDLAVHKSARPNSDVARSIPIAEFLWGTSAAPHNRGGAQDQGERGKRVKYSALHADILPAGWSINAINSSMSQT
jgi:hypothetical protein